MTRSASLTRLVDYWHSLTPETVAAIARTKAVGGRVVGCCSVVVVNGSLMALLSTDRREEASPGGRGAADRRPRWIWREVPPGPIVRDVL